MNNNITLKIRDLYKSFDNTIVLNNINLDIYNEEIVSIIGPSGSGKSTLLRCICNLENIDKGKIMLNDVLMNNNTNNRKRKIGMVFQHFNLFPHYTALENIIKPLITVEKMKLKDSKQIGLDLLNKVKLSDKKNSYPHQLSGGQKQRIAIARAVAIKPDILLFDEPTSALDPELSFEVFQTIKKLTKDGMTMVMVTHEMNFVKQVADRIIFMDEGNIIEEGSTEEIFTNCKKKRTEEFLNKIL